MHWWVVGVIRGRDRIARELKGASERQRHHHKYETDVGWHFKKWIQSPPLLRLVFYMERRTWHPSPSLSPVSVTLRHSPLLTISFQPSTLPQSLFSHHNPVEPAMHRLNSPFIQHVSYWCDWAKKNLQMPAPSRSPMASNLPRLRSILNDPFRRKKLNDALKKVGKTHAGIWM